MKKTLTILFAALLTTFLCISLTACNNSDNNGGTVNTTNLTTESAEDKLNKDEKAVYMVLISKIASFKNPSSVTLVSIEGVCKGNNPEVKISAQNGFGAFTTENYYIITSKYVSSNEFVTFPANSMIAVENAWTNPGTVISYYSKVQKKDFPSVSEVVQILNARTEFIEYDSSKIKNYSVEKINNALNEYKQKQGWR